MQPTENDYKLANVLLDHSLSIRAKEKVLISVSDNGAMGLAKAVYIEVLKRGAYPLVDMELAIQQGRSQVGGFNYQFYKLANEWQLNYIPDKVIKAKIAWADAHVRIVTDDNVMELASIDPDKLSLRARLLRPLIDPMIDSNRWVLTYYPTPGMAQQAGMALDELTEFYYKACLVDYQKMERELRGLEKIMDEGKEVRIVGQMTDLTVKIEGRLAQACYGERNIPDGEVFIGPVHTEVEGEVYFEMPTIALGHEVRGIHLEFRKGLVVKAEAEQGNESLQKMLATDKGARYLGELAIGANYKITKPMLNTLFDEKIGGTVHLALGRSYKEARGGGTNESAIHWDIVKDMRIPGSRVEIDGKVILKDGKIKS